MEVIYTQHALEKLTRPDYKKFRTTKHKIRKAINEESFKILTHSGHFAAILELNGHVLRVIYGTINSGRIK